MKNIIKIVTILFGVNISLMAEIIYIEGASTIAPVMKQSKKEYFNKHEIKLSIKGGGTDKGIECILNGRCQIGMVSRLLSQDELSKNIKPYLVGYDGIAIIVNKNNPLNNISTKNVQDIYSEKINNWNTINETNVPISLIAKHHGRSTRLLFDEYFDLQLSDKYKKLIGSDIEGIIMVALDKSAISYVSIGSAQNAINSGAEIKMLSLNGINPTKGGAINPTYPFKRELNLITVAKPSPAVQKIISIMRSNIGQQFFIDNSFISIYKSVHVE